MIYLFTHDGARIDGIYQSHPIRILLADSMFSRLWALNPMHNHVYAYSCPKNRIHLRKCFEEEEMFLNFNQKFFEPSIMIQSDQSIGLIDTNRDIFRLYAKDDPTHLITIYENPYKPDWKLTGGVIYRDNRTLLKLVQEIDRLCPIGLNQFHRIQENRLIELTADGKERRQINVKNLSSMTLGW